MLSLRSAMPISTSSRSTCSGSGPIGARPTDSLAWVTVAARGVEGSRPSSHLIRSTLEATLGGILRVRYTKTVPPLRRRYVRGPRHAASPASAGAWLFRDEGDPPRPAPARAHTHGRARPARERDLRPTTESTPRVCRNPSVGSASRAPATVARAAPTRVCTAACVAPSSAVRRVEEERRHRCRAETSCS